jgi:hypothetical protein
MEFVISYCQTQLQEAAKFIWQKNPHVKDWGQHPKSELDVYNIIYSTIVHTARKNYLLILEERKLGKELDNQWVTYTGSGGYYVTYELITDEPNKIEIGIEVLVDPVIGLRHNSITITELLEQYQDIV